MANKGTRKIGLPKTGVIWVEHQPPVELVEYFPSISGLEAEQRKGVERKVKGLISVYQANAAFAKASEEDGASWNSLASQSVELDPPIPVQIEYLRKRIKNDRVLDIVEKTREIDSFNATVKELFNTLAEAGCKPTLSHTRVVDRSDTKPTSFERFICDQLRDDGYSPASLKAIYNGLNYKD